MRISTSMMNESALNGILQDESALSNTQNELSTGLSINSPSDNPVGEVQLLQLTNTETQYQQYVSNGQAASTALNLEQSALTSATSTLQSIQSLLVQANSSSNNSSDLRSIAAQVQQLEQQLLGVANSQNASGGYLFAGYSENTQPFVRGSSGAVVYMGDSGAPARMTGRTKMPACLSASSNGSVCALRSTSASSVPVTSRTPTALLA